MAETFDIYVRPPRPSFHKVARALFEALARGGWRAESLAYLSDDLFETSAFTTLSDALAREAQIGFDKASRWISLGAGFFEPGTITIGGDITFFDSPTALAELGTALSAIRFPDKTVVVGDTEHRLRDVLESNLLPVSSARLLHFGLLWIDMITSAQWHFLRKELSLASDRILARVNDRNIAALWENPYDKFGSLDEYKRLARSAAEID